MSVSKAIRKWSRSFLAMRWWDRTAYCILLAAMMQIVVGVYVVHIKAQTQVEARTEEKAEDQILVNALTARETTELQHQMQEFHDQLHELNLPVKLNDLDHAVKDNYDQNVEIRRLLYGIFAGLLASLCANGFVIKGQVTRRRRVRDGESDEDEDYPPHQRGRRRDRDRS